MVDVVYVVLIRDSRVRIGEFFVDEDVFIEVGVIDFEFYVCVLGMSSWEDRVIGFRLGSGKDKCKGGMFILKNFFELCLLINWFDVLCF